MLFRAIVIYAYTSMFPHQLQELSPEAGPQINSCATEIIRSAQLIISQEMSELRFIVFPLFMAGFAATNPADKDLASNLLRAVERHNYGGSTESVRKLLDNIYEKQQAALMSMGNATPVDWIEEMEMSGERLIIYGL